MAIPKEPRALMIQLMYLVLTAMLALNITREVLNAFVSINDSIVRTNTTINEKNEQMYTAFNTMENEKDNAERVKPWNDKAKIVKQLSDDVYNYLESLKDTVNERGGGLLLDERTGKMLPRKMEDINATTHFFVNEGNGNIVKEKLNQFINDALAVLDDEEEKKLIRSKIPINLEDFTPNDDNPSGDWAHGTFNNIPVVAASTILSKFQSDVRNAEGLIVENLFTHIDDGRIIFDELEPIAVPNSSYALPGDEIKATVTLAAYNKNVNPQVTGPGAIKVENGVGTVTFKASNNIGKNTVRGRVSLPVSSGETVTKDWSFDYYVGTTGGSLQLDKMNVFYIGVDNPVTVSASGFNIEDVDLVIPAASKKTLVAGTKNKYLIEVDKPNPKDGIPYYIKGKNKNGSWTDIATGNIRVKFLPTPTAYYGQQTGGDMEAAKFKVQKGVYASLGQDFDFDVKFSIVSYTVVLVNRDGMGNSKVNNGGNLAGEASNLVQMARAGDMVIFKDIKSKGPDGKVRTLSPITIQLK